MMIIIIIMIIIIKINDKNNNNNDDYKNHTLIKIVKATLTGTIHLYNVKERR